MEDNQYYFCKSFFIIILFSVYIIFVNYNFKIGIFIINNNLDYDLLIPSSFSDIKFFNRHKEFYKKYLNFSNIILIGDSNINEKLSLNDTSISFIPEDNLVPKNMINEFLMKMRAMNTSRDGWYEQQFLKMAYSKICQKEYYLVWDIDTIPIRPINMFEMNHPIFDMKTEHHIPYFDTIENLFPGIKYNNKSYISEHMLIKTKLMRKLLFDIEENYRLPGKLFWEKILMAIEIEDINLSGFSEYETYGSYVDSKYPNYYYHRNWFSKRDTSTFFNTSENLNENDIKWLSQDYHALSFEKWIKFEEKNLEIVKNIDLQKLYNPNIFFMNYDYMIRKNKKFNRTRNKSKNIYFEIRKYLNYYK